MENGIISKELTKAVAKKADSQFDFTKFEKLGFVGNLLEAVDDDIIYLSLNFIDNRYGNEVPEAAQKAVVTLFEAYAYDKWELVSEDVSEAVNAYLNIPLLDEDFEGNLIKGIVDALIRFIKSKKKGN